MRNLDVARKIVLDKRGEIYAKWRNEIPLAIEIAEGFADVCETCVWLFRRDIQGLEGIPHDSFRVEVSDWVIRELWGRIDLTKSLKSAMPGAMRRARKFLIEGLALHNIKENGLRGLRGVRAILSGQYGYRGPGEEYGFRVYWDNDGRASYLGIQIRDKARFGGMPLSASRAHRCFRDIRRRMVAWCIGAGEGRMEPMGGYIKIHSNESIAYDRCAQNEFLDFYGDQSVAYIEAGEKVIQAAIAKIKDLEAKRQVALEESKNIVNKARREIGAVRSAYEAERADAATRWPTPRTPPHRFMEPIVENGWRARPPSNYYETLLAAAPEFTLDHTASSIVSVVQDLHVFVRSEATAHLRGLGPGRSESGLQLSIGLPVPHVREGAPIVFSLERDRPASQISFTPNGSSEIFRSMMDSYIRPTSAYYTIENVPSDPVF